MAHRDRPKPAAGLPYRIGLPAWAFPGWKDRYFPARPSALAGYARVMAQPPKLLALASVLEQKGLHVPAWAALFTARQLAPRDVEVQLRLASSWLKRGRPRRALALLTAEPADASTAASAIPASPAEPSTTDLSPNLSWARAAS